LGHAAFAVVVRRLEEATTWGLIKAPRDMRCEGWDLRPRAARSCEHRHEITIKWDTVLNIPGRSEKGTGVTETKESMFPRDTVQGAMARKGKELGRDTTKWTVVTGRGGFEGNYCQYSYDKAVFWVTEASEKGSLAAYQDRTRLRSNHAKRGRPGWATMADTCIRQGEAQGQLPDLAAWCRLGNAHAGGVCQESTGSKRGREQAEDREEEEGPRRRRMTQERPVEGMEEEGGGGRRGEGGRSAEM
jgi:hypothetical protein